MRIGLRHIDPQIAAAMQDRLCAPLPQFLKDDIRWSKPNAYLFDLDPFKKKKKRDPGKDERIAYAVRQKRDAIAMHRSLTTTFAPLVMGLGIGFLLNAGGFGFGWPLGIVLWLALTAAGIVWTRQAMPERYLRYELSIEEMRATFRLLTLSRAERVYCDTLLLIASLEPNQEARNTIRATLAQLNTLIEDSRSLERRKQSLLPVLGSNSVAELEAERTALQARIASASDTVTRQSLEQSASMVTTRIENAKTFEQALVRINAQQEALIHAFASVQSALARIQVAPSPVTDQASQEIAETVEQMNQQTRSVESAVEEVLTLRVS